MSDLVKRYDPFFMSDLGEKIRAFMEEDEYGDYVDYQDHRELQSKYEALVADFACCMDSAADDIDDWGGYASEYFQQKHNLNGDVKTYRDKAKQLHALLEDDNEMR